MPFSSLQIQTLRPLLDRLIPKDEEPSACEAGVDVFIIELLSHEAKDQAALVLKGLEGLETEAMARFQKAFSAMDVMAQDALLDSFDPAFMSQMAELCARGYYGRKLN